MRHSVRRIPGRVFPSEGFRSAAFPSAAVRNARSAARGLGRMRIRARGPGEPRARPVKGTQRRTVARYGKVERYRRIRATMTRPNILCAAGPRPRGKTSRRVAVLVVPIAPCSDGRAGLPTRPPDGPHPQNRPHLLDQPHLPNRLHPPGRSDPPVWQSPLVRQIPPVRPPRLERPHPPERSSPAERSGLRERGSPPDENLLGTSVIRRSPVCPEVVTRR
ncbi:hypothetical protein NONO_c45770 [Nocardia nova SH22a]|uniref:Uncharacterized protein n=1 Tax=Nocardia nova SH22a TaxID=1415166 RepID=W5TQ65_9NOCA|nr:hypothetical protein NONO_c45770 [Nocardia nova SH22a]